MRLFDPEANGWILQRGFPVEFHATVREEEGELGNVITQAVSERILRTWDVMYRGFSRVAQDYMEGFWAAEVGHAGRFEWVTPEYLPRPFEAPSVEAVAGGAQGARSITVRFAWRDPATGRSPASPTATIAVPANSLVRVMVPRQPPGVSQAVIYAAQDDPGAEQEQVTLTEHDRDWTQPDAALLLATTSPPETHAARGRIVAKFAANGLRITRGIGVAYEAQVRLEETYA